VVAHGCSPSGWADGESVTSCGCAQGLLPRTGEQGWGPGSPVVVAHGVLSSIRGVCCGLVTSCGCALPPPWAVRVVGLFVTSCGCARVLLAQCGFGTGSPVVVACRASPRIWVRPSAHQLWLRMTSSLPFAVGCRGLVTSCGCARRPPLLGGRRVGRGSPVVVAHGALLSGRAGGGAVHQLWLCTKLSSVDAVGAVWRFHQLWLRTALSSSSGVDARRSSESPVVVAHAATSSHRPCRDSAEVARRDPGVGSRIAGEMRRRSHTSGSEHEGGLRCILVSVSPREPRSRAHSAYLTDPGVGSLRPVAPSRVTVTRAGGLAPRVGGPRRRAPLGSGRRPGDTESADGN
jgi:hypothetical protein